MNTKLFFVAIAIVAAFGTAVGFASVTPALAVVHESLMGGNATEGNMTGGNMTGGNMTMGDNMTMGG
jgi:hypothetical protein